MTTSFDALNLAKPLLDALALLNITSPTPVQAEVLPRAMQGTDLMVSSQTGSGKTFAFLLPVMHGIMTAEQSPMNALQGPSVLVLCPTRELAQQVSQDAINLVKCHKGLRIASVVGGMPYGKQMAGLRGAALVVGTPGRLLDLAQQGKLNLSTVKHLIIDEADRMLDLGFAPDLEAIDGLCKNRQQTLMFSATFAKRIVGLAEAIMNEPQRVEMAPSNETNTDVDQKLMWADSRTHKRKILDHWLEHGEIDQAVVFTSTQTDAEDLARSLADEGVRACALHGAMPQVVRNRRLASVRRGDIQILVATDVAARGLDVPAITHVINYGMPMKPEDYVHRIGRTGRAGRSGTAITLAEAGDIIKVREIERFISNKIPEAQIEGLEPRGDFTRAPRGAGRGQGRGQGRGSQGRFNDRSSGNNYQGDRPQGRSFSRPSDRSEFRGESRGGFRSEGRPVNRQEGRPEGRPEGRSFFREEGRSFRDDNRSAPRGDFRPSGRDDQRGDQRGDRGRSDQAKPAFGARGDFNPERREFKKFDSTDSFQNRKPRSFDRNSTQGSRDERRGSDERKPSAIRDSSFGARRSQSGDSAGFTPAARKDTRPVKPSAGPREGGFKSERGGFTRRRTA